MTVRGFSGNPRYLIVPAALLIVARRRRRSCGRSGAVARRGRRGCPAGGARRRARSPSPRVFALPDARPRSKPTLRGIEYQADLYDDLGTLVDEAGGAGARPRAAATRTPGPFLVPQVAWTLGPPRQRRRPRARGARGRLPRPHDRALARRPADVRAGAPERRWPAQGHWLLTGRLRSARDELASPRRAAGADAHRARRDAPAVGCTAGARRCSSLVVAPALRTRALDARVLDRRGPLGRHRLARLLRHPGACCEQDGSPPLYYLLLHLWMQAFGNGEAATHVAVARLRAAHRSPSRSGPARSLFGRARGLDRRGARRAQPVPHVLRAGDADVRARGAARACSSPRRSCTRSSRRDRRYLAAVRASSLAAMLYTHNWATLPRRRRRSSRCALLWRWTRAGGPPRARSRDGAARLRRSRRCSTCRGCRRCSSRRCTPARRGPSGPRLDDARSTALALVLGGATAGRRAAARRRQRHRRAGPRGRRDRRVARAARPRRSRRVLLAWLASQVSPAFANRYFAVVRRAAAPARRRRRWRAAGRLGLICSSLLVAASGSTRGPATLSTRATSARSRRASRRSSPPGDLVVSTHPEQLPLVAYYLPDGVRYANSLGPGRRPAASSTGATRSTACRTTKPTPTIDRLRPHARSPARSSCSSSRSCAPARWGAPWTSLVRAPRRCSGSARLDARPADAPRGRRPGVRLRPRCRAASAPSSIAYAVPARRVSDC